MSVGLGKEVVTLEKEHTRHYLGETNERGTRLFGGGI